MNPLVRFRKRSPLSVAAALLLLFSLASPASASPETIKRSVTNTLFGPLDFVLGPVVGARSVYNNLRDIEDTTGVRTPPPICMAEFQATPGTAKAMRTPVVSSMSRRLL